MKFHLDGTRPDEGAAVFVFGSNLAGLHGAAAAKVATKYYGARYYSAVGRQGQSYAIPTKNERLMSLPRALIKVQVNIFLEYARATPKEQFFCTRIGCGLAGYKDKDIAPMFEGAPDNCSFAEQWRPFLQDAEASQPSST
jgi:hypothetical protein